MEKFRVRTMGLVFASETAGAETACSAAVAFSWLERGIVKLIRARFPCRENQVRLAIDLWTCKVEMVPETAFPLSSLSLLF